MVVESPWPLTFSKVTKTSTLFRHMNGSCPSITSYNSLWWIKNIFWPSYSIFCFFISFYTVIYYDIKKGNYADAIRNGTMSIVGLTVCFKHVLLLRYHKSMQDLIRIIDEDYETAKNFSKEEKEIVLKYSQMGTDICKFWFIVAIVTSWMFPVRAIAMMGHSYYKGEFQLVPVMDLSYPFIDDYKEYPVNFCVLFFLCFSFAMYSATVYIGFDPLIPVIMTHACGQLELISNNMIKLFSPDKNTQQINEDLKQINIKLMEIYSIVDTVQNNFVVLYEFIMKSTTFLISFSAFQIVECLKRKEISVEFMSFFIGSILHFYSPCYYSNLLMDKSELLRQAIYSSGWEMHTNIKIRKTILIMLTRTTKFLVIRTVFVPISLDTFAEVARQAYGIYNLMNAAWG